MAAPQSSKYMPYEPGTYILNVTYGGHQVPATIPLTHPSDSPFKVPVHDVTDASKSFQVDTSKAGVALLQVKVQGPKGQVEPVDVMDNADGTQTINYVPSQEGPYSISVLYGDEEVPRR
ncbi:hypothetical protein P7K49_002310 [Saguinus oedipus]|uniref:Uncharacterized protein n=1 Tax=Saguinus oedipus TaxID=9490 RepID=A0ABQ9WJ15_SAGOE|nr:hypothetical protein P7K49_002310 [Saguinus oedipus]